MGGLAMLERRRSRRMSSARHDNLWDLSQDVARSLEALLKSVPGLPVAMHEGTLRAARELLLISDFHHRLKRIDLSRVEPAYAGHLAQLGQGASQGLPRPASRTPHQPVYPWLNKRASEPRADLNTLLTRVADVSRPTVAKLGVGVTAGMSLILWLSASGTQISGQSGRYSDPQQKRHAAALATKRAQLRSFVGPDGNTWYPPYRGSGGDGSRSKRGLSVAGGRGQGARVYGRASLNATRLTECHVLRVNSVRLKPR